MFYIKEDYLTLQNPMTNKPTDNGWEDELKRMLYDHVEDCKVVSMGGIMKIIDDSEQRFIDFIKTQRLLARQEGLKKLQAIIDKYSAGDFDDRARGFIEMEEVVSELTQKEE